MNAIKKCNYLHSRKGGKRKIRSTFNETKMGGKIKEKQKKDQHARRENWGKEKEHLIPTGTNAKPLLRARDSWNYASHLYHLFRSISSQVNKLGRLKIRGKINTRGEKERKKWIRGSCKMGCGVTGRNRWKSKNNGEREKKRGWKEGTKKTKKWHEIIKRRTRRKRTLKDVDDDERGPDKRKKKWRKGGMKRVRYQIEDAERDATVFEFLNPASTERKRRFWQRKEKNNRKTKKRKEKNTKKKKKTWKIERKGKMKRKT